MPLWVFVRRVLKAVGLGEVSGEDLNSRCVFAGSGSPLIGQLQGRGSLVSQPVLALPSWVCCFPGPGAETPPRPPCCLWGGQVRGPACLTSCAGEEAPGRGPHQLCPPGTLSFLPVTCCVCCGSLASLFSSVSVPTVHLPETCRASCCPASSGQSRSGQLVLLCPVLALMWQFWQVSPGSQLQLHAEA